MPMQLKKNICLFVLLLFVLTKASAQANDFNYRTSLKKTITADDTAYLKEVLGEFGKPDLNFSFDLTTFEMAANRPDWERTKPSSLEEIEKLNKKIKATTDPIKRADYYLGIGNNYKRLNRLALAHSAYVNAYTELAPQIQTPPADSATLYTICGILTCLDSSDRAIYFFEKLRPISEGGDISASTFIPLLYMKQGKIAEASNAIDRNLKKWPEGEIGYYYNIMVQVYTFMQLAPYRKDFITSDRFFNQPPDSIFDFSGLYKLHKKYPDNIMWEQFYKGGLVMGMILRNNIYGIMTGIGGGITSFKTSPIEKAMLDTLREDFERLATTKRNHNKYFAYKTLGTIYFLQHDLKNSLEWYEKALKEKELKNSNYESNAAEIYDKIETFYLAMGDTAQAQKTLIKKIKKVPAFNPIADDFVRMGYYHLLDKNIALATKNYTTAVATDSFNAKAYTGMAICNLLQGDYEGAKQHLTAAIRMDREDFYTSYVFGINSILAGDERTAYIMLNNAYTLAGANKKNLSTIDEIMLRFYGKEEF
jgi:tetratricopeptide (TPR) repeat protein